MDTKNKFTAKEIADLIASLFPKLPNGRYVPSAIAFPWKSFCESTGRKTTGSWVLEKLPKYLRARRLTADLELLSKSEDSLFGTLFLIVELLPDGYDVYPKQVGHNIKSMLASTPGPDQGGSNLVKVGGTDQTLNFISSDIIPGAFLMYVVIAPSLHQTKVAPSIPDKYRLSFSPNLDEYPGLRYTEEGFDTEEAASRALDTLAHYTLFLHKQGIMTDYSNAGWVEVFDDGDWCTLNDDNGDDSTYVECLKPVTEVLPNSTTRMPPATPVECPNTAPEKVFVYGDSESWVEDIEYTYIPAQQLPTLEFHPSFFSSRFLLRKPVKSLIEEANSAVLVALSGKICVGAYMDYKSGLLFKQLPGCNSLPTIFDKAFKFHNSQDRDYLITTTADDLLTIPPRVYLASIPEGRTHAKREAWNKANKDFTKALTKYRKEFGPDAPVSAIMKHGGVLAAWKLNLDEPVSLLPGVIIETHPLFRLRSYPLNTYPNPAR